MTDLKPSDKDKQQEPTPAVPLTPEQRRAQALGLDRLITWGLLILAGYSVFTGLGDYINPRVSMNAVYDELNTLEPKLGLGAYGNIQAATMIGWVAVTVQAVILGLTVWLSITRMRAKKMAWWVPVLGGILNTLLALVWMTAACLVDPAFVNAIQEFAATVQSTPVPSGVISS